MAEGTAGGPGTGSGITGGMGSAGFSTGVTLSGKETTEVTGLSALLPAQPTSISNSESDKTFREMGQVFILEGNLTEQMMLNITGHGLHQPDGTR
ncbi:TPA: hypothetical protein OMU28_002063 [Klebsiella aerogenes]|nr:hypothetical protein [Klebsiella aerogenes]